MKYIDEKFKAVPPLCTVERIRNILSDLDIEMNDTWIDIGVENSNTVRVMTKCGFPVTTGKGITKEFAMASGYAEFIERLQSGLMFYKFQCLEDDPSLNQHTYAPDAVYMTRSELIENGEWMDHIIQSYNCGLTRESIADQCLMYANDSKALCLPFYSYFEKKHVLLPAAFIEHMYSANGCCVGNNREEAWVHAISEIFERNASIYYILHNDACPCISEETLCSFPTVNHILTQLRADGHLDVTVFDLSRGTGIPVIATRVINLETQDYIVDVGADPILEIAIERTLTEIFHGRAIDKLATYHPRKQIKRTSAEVSTVSNVLNQLETADGQFSAAFFCDDPENSRSKSDFPDYTELTNPELVRILLDKLKALNKPVYIRNYSYLGFPCYKFIVPGFSESRGIRLSQPVQEYYFGIIASRVLRNIEQASDADLDTLLMYRKMSASALSRANSFSYLSGIPLDSRESAAMLPLHYAYAEYKLGRYAEAAQDLYRYAQFCERAPDKAFFSCFGRYCSFLAQKYDSETACLVLDKLFPTETSVVFRAALKCDALFGTRLLRCSKENCSKCSYASHCHYSFAASLVARAGKIYATFKDGQAPEEFRLA